MDIQWYHIFDAGTSKWLQDDEVTWGQYSEAAEFHNEETVKGVAEREQRNNPRRTVVILADLGSA